MNIIRTAIITLFVSWPAAALGQSFELDLEEVSASEFLYKAVISLYESGATIDDGIVEDELFPVSFEFFVHLNQSNNWIIERGDSNELTEEERFAKSLFLTRQNMTSPSDLQPFLEREFYLERVEQFERDRGQFEREVAAFKSFEDIKLLGLVRYGEFYFILNYIRTDGESDSLIRSAFLARKSESGYLQSNALSEDMTTSFFFTGKLQEIIYSKFSEELEEQ